MLRVLGSRTAPGFVRLLTPVSSQAARAFSNRTIATDEEQAVGLERLELMHNKEGKQLFDGHLEGHFGTKEKPVLIESINHQRLVGCPGDCANPAGTETHNELRWFYVRDNAQTECPHCKQVFALKKIEPIQVAGGASH